MKNHKELIEKLIWATKRMNEALENKNISVVEEMIQRREELLKAYGELENFDRDAEDDANIAQLIDLDKKNNILFESIVEKERKKITNASKKKNEAKKKTVAVKKYIYGGLSTSEFSKFNKKT